MKSEWKWRNLRSIGLSIGFWPLDWALGFSRWDDEFGGCMELGAGPFQFLFSYNNGDGNR